jgi:hypothetical protein
MTWGIALGNIRRITSNNPEILKNTKFIYDYIKKLQAEQKTYEDVARAAMYVHQVIWFYGENNAFPDGLTELPILDAILSDALSRIPPITEQE